MSRLVINGGKPLCGKLAVHGAKNAVLPILAASVLCDSGVNVIHNCPDLRDVTITIEILQYLGAHVTRVGHTLTIDARGPLGSHIPEHLMQQLRSSIIFMGAIAARRGKAKISMPGGCELGPRPIDLHIKALRELGCEIKEKKDTLKDKVLAKYKVSFWEKIALPITTFIFVLLGVPLAITPPRVRHNRGFLFTIGIIFFYYVIRAFSMSLGYNSTIPAFLAANMANIILGIIGFFLYKKKSENI